MNFSAFLKNYWPPFHEYFHYLSLAVLAVGLPLSSFFMGMANFMFFGNWLVGNIIGYFLFNKDVKMDFIRFYKNKAAFVFASFFFLHLLGLFYTTDFSYALKDLRIKLPILAMPFLLVNLPKLKKPYFIWLFLLFIVSVFAATVVSLTVFFRNDYVNIREISIFVSHIRFSLYIAFSIFLLIYFVFFEPYFQHRTKYFFLLLVVYFFLFLVVMQSATGISIVLLTFFILSFLLITKIRNRFFRFGLVFIVLFAITFLVFQVIAFYNKNFSPKEIAIEQFDRFSPSGNKYHHDFDAHYIENGFRTHTYIVHEELKKEWSKRSEIDYYGKDRKGQDLKSTLIRFLTSKGLRKDSVGVRALTNKEVESIENGIANVRYTEKMDISNRLYKAMWEIYEYQHTKNPSGHSLAQRIEHWKAAIKIISNHFFLGTGTGDANTEFEKQYQLMNTKLHPDFWFRSHNQFLSVMVAFGILGLIWFFIFLVYPPISQNAFKYFPYLVFFIIALLSMITEDTLESQAGVSFFTFFSCLFLFVKKETSDYHFFK